MDSHGHLIRHINAVVLRGLDLGPTDGVWRRVVEAGYTGLQHYFPEDGAIAAGLEMSGMARSTAPSQIDGVVAQHKAWGFVATTFHLGTGLETDSEMDAYAAALIEACVRHSYPASVETHRATITQDMRRTVDLVARFPELRFNADLSHWYTGHEMVYGDFQSKVDFIEPVLSRVAYIHGRIGHSCSMQVSLEDARRVGSMTHFEALLTRCAKGAKARGEGIVFAPELLPPSVEFGGQIHRLNYAPARMEGGSEVETTDRWAESIALCDMMQRIWDEA
jgi:hypothetical protein